MGAQLLALISTLPTVLLLLIVVLEPVLYGIGIDREIVADVSDWIRGICFVLVVVMVFYYGRMVYRSEDSRLSGRRGLWINVLILGNLFAIPIFWYLFIRKQKVAPQQGNTRRAT